MPPATPPRPAVSPADGSVSTDWTLHTLATTPSTNLAARTLAPWHAVRSDIQTGGYGRTGRSWVSDTGGLWLSAVLPCPGPREPWSILPLAAGWAVIKALNGLHVSGLRLRWPNDILSDQRKLAGLLVERHSADTAIVGIGINIFNSAETADPVLHGMTTRLADLIDLGDRTLDDIAHLVLNTLTHAHALLLENQVPRIIDHLNQSWAQPRLVALTLAGQPTACVGRFLGIDHRGRLLLGERDGTVQTYDATRVAHLRELE